MRKFEPETKLSEIDEDQLHMMQEFIYANTGFLFGRQPTRPNDFALVAYDEVQVLDSRLTISDTVNIVVATQKEKGVPKKVEGCLNIFPMRN